MIGTAIEAKGIISARTNFYDAVDGEVLWIVFQIVPRTRVNVPHVGAGNVDIVFITGLRRLGFTPVSVQERRAVVPAILAFARCVRKTGPKVP